MSLNLLLVTVASGFESKAKQEIYRILPDYPVEGLFFKGILVVNGVVDVGAALKLLKDSPTKYIAKIFPINEWIKVTKDISNINQVVEAVITLDKIKKNDVFRVSCVRRGTHNYSSRDIEIAVGRKIEESIGALVDLNNPEKVVTIQIFQNECLIGVSCKDDLVSKKILEYKKYAKGERPFTRAEFKLKEAIKEFQISFDSDSKALDLGAAPGGWSKALADYGLFVTAVDPANLNNSLYENSHITHLKIRSEYLPDDMGLYDIITNDMNLDPVESAKIMNSTAKFLKKTGIAVMTIKFVTRDRGKHVNDAIDILKQHYHGFKVKKMYHNKFETTMFMIKND
jgi:23S rRNA (cytidine2498-2'-O)-methyltransferase